MRRWLGVLAALAVAIAVASSGCEALVAGDVPGFACTPGGTDVCPAGQVCSPAGLCLASCPDTPCASELICDEDTHLCVPGLDSDGGGDVTVPDQIGPDTTPSDVGKDTPFDTGSKGAIGDACLTTASCNAGLFCADSSVLTSAVVSTTGPVCTKPCCKSEDCPADFACFGPGTGGNFCVRASQLPRATARGSGTGGASCTDASGCRSGVCLDQNGVKRCADACCQDGACSGGGLCALATVEGHLTMACSEPPAGGSSVGQSCFSNDCNNGLCVGSTCRARCCGKTTCSGTTRSCTYLSQQGATVQEYVPACVPATLGTGKVGDSCTNPDGSECASGFCEVALQKCTDVCCADADCAGYAGYTACRPDTNPNVHYLICSKP
jgi:hypothetical protein